MICQNITLPLSIMELETLAAGRTLELSLERGFNSVILEGGSETVMKALRDNSSSLASFGLLIRDIKIHAELFHCISSSHVGRDGNSVTHNLTRHARHVTSFSM